MLARPWQLDWQLEIHPHVLSISACASLCLSYVSKRESMLNESVSYPPSLLSVYGGSLKINLRKYKINVEAKIASNDS